MKIFIGFGMVIIYLIIMAFLIGMKFGFNDALARKCADTQGRYDFCVAVTNWEVKE